MDGLLEVAGACVDIVKLGWGTALVTANLKPKLERYAAHGIPVVLGGTLTELAIRQGRMDGLIEWLRELGLRHVEISDGTIALEPDYKRGLIERLSGEFVVLAEVGNKDADFIMAPYVWVEQIERDLDAGAWKVITEARESGNAGIYRADGEPRTGLIDEIAHAVDPEQLIFEAPLRPQQVWLLKRFGTECNLGNIAPDDVLSLETLRLGLRSDTVERFALGETENGRGRLTSRGAKRVTDRPARLRVRAAGARVLRRVLSDAAPQAHADGGAAVQAHAALLADAVGGHIKEERISFKLARADEVTVTIVDSAGTDVARLLHDFPVQRYKQLSLRWTGRQGTAHGYSLVAGPDGRSAISRRLAGAAGAGRRIPRARDAARAASHGAVAAQLHVGAPMSVAHPGDRR